MRHFQPLDIPPLPELSGDTEVLLLTSALELSPDETWRQSVALVMVHPTDLQRRQVRALAATFITVRVSFHSPPEELSLGEWLADTLASTASDSVVVILSSPESRSTIGDHVITELPQALRARLKERLDLLLLVADGAPFLPEGFHSLVQGGIEQALLMLELTSALMAPTMHPCCDVYDLVEMMPPGLVFRIVPALWMLEEDRLLLPTTDAKAWLTRSSHIVVALQGESQMDALRRISEGVRALAPHDASQLQIHGYGHRTTPEYLSAQVQHILMLCSATPHQ